MPTSPTTTAQSEPRVDALTLHAFLALTSTTPQPTLRRALAAALAVETPKTRSGFVRFYGRVLIKLGNPIDAQNQRSASHALSAVA